VTVEPPDLSAILDHLPGASTGASGRPVTFAEPPRRLTGGRDTDVFALRLHGVTGPLAGPLVLRAFAPGAHRRAEFEVQAHGVLSSLGCPVPEVYFQGELPDDVPYFLMRLIPGKPAADYLVPPTRTAPRLSRILATAHVAIHVLPTVPVETALTPHAIRALHPLEDLVLRLGWLAEAGDHRFEAVRDWLVANEPSGQPDVVCHADFHPMNVMLDRGSVTGIIDWANLTLAPAEYDVARTLLTTIDGPVELPPYLAPVAGAVRRWLAASYLANYRALRPLDSELLRFYTALAAVVMLVEAAQAAHTRKAHAWQSPRSASRLIAHVTRITAIQSGHLSTPAVEAA